MAATAPSVGRLIDILLDVQESRGTGVVRFEGDRATRQLALCNGDVAFAESSLPDEHLARFLMKIGHLQRADLQKIADAMKRGLSSDAAVLEVTTLDLRDLEEGAREQAVSITASLMPVADRPSRFHPLTGPLHRSLNLGIPVPQLLVEAARRAAGSRQLPHSYLNLEGIIRSVDPSRPAMLNLPLDGAEAFAYAELREPARTADLGVRLGSLAVGAEEIVRRLVLLGLVRVQKDVASPAAATTAAPQEQAADKISDLLFAFERATHYEILSIPADATDDQIREAYHELARRYHPDRFQSDEFGAEIKAAVGRLFTYITGAYSVLIEPAARAKYDSEVEAQSKSAEGPLDSRNRTEQENEKMADALYRAGRAALSRQEYEKAMAHFKECVWLRPKIAKYHHYLGLAQLEIPRRRKDAEQNFLTAIRLQPTLSASHVALARLYVSVGLPRRAEAQLVELLGWDPENRAARTLLESIGSQRASAS